MIRPCINYLSIAKIRSKLVRLPEEFHLVGNWNMRMNLLWDGRYCDGCRSIKYLMENPDETVCHCSELQCEVLSQYMSEVLDRKSTRLNYSHVAISYTVFCL